jgi:uncharacterized protein (TIGR02147 family)
MISVFEYTNYRSYISDRLQQMPKKGYGQARNLSSFLKVHTTLVSQVLKGLKSFTLEQASLASEFLGLNDMETEYFLLLVQMDRAGNESLRKNLKRQIERLREKSSELINRLKSDRVLTEERRAIFYSDWTYSAIRQLTAIPGFQSLDAISQYLRLPNRKTKDAIEFLLEVGLCVEERGKIKIGPSSTHLESTSPWVRSHHINWRQKAIESMTNDEPAKLHYTCPLTISKEDALRIREKITKLLEEFDEVLVPSPSEQLRCLNIDWFSL